MRCPVCEQTLQETTPSCPRCSFDLAIADQHLGIVPRLQTGLSDLAEVFSPAECLRLEGLLDEKGRRFPQLSFAIVTTSLPTHIPLRAYTFWLLNRGSLVSAMEKGGDCRLVLFVLEPSRPELCCMLGYGLEPFVSLASLQALLRPAQPLLMLHSAALALEAAIHETDRIFTGICRDIPLVFGLGESMESGTAEITAEEYAY